MAPTSQAPTEGRSPISHHEYASQGDDQSTEHVGVAERRRAFGARLREARKAAGMSLRDLSTATGLHHTTLGAMERGDKGGKDETVAKIEQALDLPAGELGWLLGQALAPPGRSTEAAITAADDLTPLERRVLLATLAALRAESPTPMTPRARGQLQAGAGVTAGRAHHPDRRRKGGEPK